LSTETLLKVASPLTAATTNVPDKVPLPGLLLIANVMLSVAVGTRFPPASCTWTLMAGEIATVETVLVGSTLNASCAAAPSVMLKLAEVAVVNPVTVASKVYPLPTLSIETLLKVASPLTAATTNVPDKVPLPGLLLIANVILSVADVTKFPATSCISTFIAGAMDAADVVLLGSILKASLTGVLGVILKLADVAVLKPVALASKV